jgi:hypothetical protein
MELKNQNKILQVEHNRLLVKEVLVHLLQVDIILVNFKV